MVNPRMVDADVLAAALRTLAAVSWPVPIGDVPALVAALGWTVVPGTEGEFLKADTGWPVSRTTADFSSDRFGLTEVSFPVSDIVLDKTPWRADFINDALSTAVATATAELGGPSTRIRKPNPKVWWDLPNGGRITVSAIELAVSVDVHSAEYSAVMRDLGN